MAVTPATSPSRARVAQLLWVGFVLLAVMEVLSHATTVARVPPRSDWRAAAAFVRAEWRAGDVATSAPAYTDPILREVLGDRIGVADAGRADLDAYGRLWVLSIDGMRSPEEPSGRVELSREFGRVHVARWSLGASPMRYDFTRHVREAEVARIENGAPVPCPWRDFFSPTGGGLGVGPMIPRERFTCDPGRPWLWVGETVIEDLELAPRHCIYEHPPGREPVRVTFHDVPLGTRIVLAGGVHWVWERTRTYAPVDVAIAVNGHEIGGMQHRDGEGWKRVEAQTAERDGTRGDVTISVSTSNEAWRQFCWSAKTEAGPRRPPPPGTR